MKLILVELIVSIVKQQYKIIRKILAIIWVLKKSVKLHNSQKFLAYAKQQKTIQTTLSLNYTFTI